jgi:hypothetical protein
MPTGPRGEKRPADVSGGAIMVARISVGDVLEPIKEAPGRVRSGRAGAKARFGKLTAEQRQEVARKAAAARWK